MCCRQLLWDLVNTTLVLTDEEEIVGQVGATVGQIEEKLHTVCEKDEPEVADCEGAEYEHTTAYIAMLDTTLSEGESMLELEAVLSGRLSQLYSAQLCCAGEAQLLQTEYL